MSMISTLHTLIDTNYNIIKSKQFTESIPSIDLAHKIFDKCCNFVEITCVGRDSSHGYQHMLQVTYNALIIFEQLQKLSDKLVYQDLIDVIVFAMLHDVADYKYDVDGKLEQTVIKFIDDLCKDEIHPFHKLWVLINNLSYSKEKKAGGYHKLPEVSTFPYRINRVRDIVADADRLEAIGKIGAERCIEYGRHVYPNMTEKELKDKVKEHAEEKLYKLPFPDENGYRYIKTIPGIIMAEQRHKETVKYINNFIEN